MRFKKMLTEYEQGLKVRCFAETTIKSNHRIITRLCRYLTGRNIRFSDVTFREIVDFKEFLLASGKYSHNYVHLQITVVKGFFRFLYAHRYIERDDVASHSYIKPKRELPKDLPSQEEIYNMLQEANLSVMDSCIIELYYATGIRLSELISLNLDNIDFKSNLLFIKEGKWKRDRIVPLTDHVIGLLHDYISVRKQGLDGSALFLSTTGKRVSETVIAKIFKRLKEASKSNRRLSSHVLRHCFATHILENGASIRDIQEILGHSDIGTTQRYTKVDISDLKRIIKRFHPRENEIYSSEEIILPKNQFFTRRKGCTRNRKRF